MTARATVTVDLVPVPEVGIIWVTWDGTGRRGHRASVGAVRSRGCERDLLMAAGNVNQVDGPTKLRRRCTESTASRREL
jgi:hypothetical protein